MDWQPIATAPPGEDILGFFPDADTPVMIVHSFDPDDGAGREWYEQNADLCPDALIVEPTHWMPLPAPPKGRP